MNASELWAAIEKELKTIQSLGLENAHLRNKIFALQKELDALAVRRKDSELLDATMQYTFEMVGNMTKANSASDDMTIQIMDTTSDLQLDLPVPISRLEKILETARSARIAAEIVRRNLIDILDQVKQLKSDSEPKA